MKMEFLEWLEKLCLQNEIEETEKSGDKFKWAKENVKILYNLLYIWETSD